MYLLAKMVTDPSAEIRGEVEHLDEWVAVTVLLTVLETTKLCLVVKTEVKVLNTRERTLKLSPCASVRFIFRYPSFAYTISTRRRGFGGRGGFRGFVGVEGAETDAPAVAAYDG